MKITAADPRRSPATVELPTHIPLYSQVSGAVVRCPVVGYSTASLQVDLTGTVLAAQCDIASERAVVVLDASEGCGQGAARGRLCVHGVEGHATLATLRRVARARRAQQTPAPRPAV